VGLGFGYATCFHRFFKPRTGTTPLAFGRAAWLRSREPCQGISDPTNWLDVSLTKNAGLLSRRFSLNGRWVSHLAAGLWGRKQVAVLAGFSFKRQTVFSILPFP
jgi:hypothetical protein